MMAMRYDFFHTLREMFIMGCNVGLRLGIAVWLLTSLGCNDPKTSTSTGGQGSSHASPPPSGIMAGGQSDAKMVAAADYSILFVGNSHTGHHHLPGLVCDLIRFRHPDKTAYAHFIPVMFLDAAALDPICREELATRPWKYAVFQAQKISLSGKHDDSRQEGIAIAKLAKGRGVKVFYYAEWGIKGVPGDGLRHEKVYREMAREAEVEVAAVGRAWDLALAKRPDLPLYEADGNHQSATGAFLTACVLFSRITGDSPLPLSGYPYQPIAASDRAFLSEIAAKAVAEPSTEP